MSILLQLWQPVWEFLLVAVEIGLITALIYTILYFLRGTRALPVIIGIGITTFVGFLVSSQLDMVVIEWLLTKVPSLLAVTLLIVFQPELRRAFAEIGVAPRLLLTSADHNEEDAIKAMIEAAYSLSRTKTGALIAIERNIGMRSYIESGVQINASISPELLITLFDTGTPLHDGAVVVKDGVIVAAGCFFPLTQAPLSRALGTRHRAGIGITEETDSVVIIVSEEKGWVSLSHRGVLVQDISAERLRRHLINYLIKRKDVVPKKAVAMPVEPEASEQ